MPICRASRPQRDNARIIDAYKLDVAASTPDPFSRAPFAVVYSQCEDPDGYVHDGTFITQPEVLTTKNTDYWRFRIDSQASQPFRADFLIVNEAKPVRLSSPPLGQSPE